MYYVDFYIPLDKLGQKIYCWSLVSARVDFDPPASIYLISRIPKILPDHIKYSWESHHHRAKVLYSTCIR